MDRRRVLTAIAAAATAPAALTTSVFAQQADQSAPENAREFSASSARMFQDELYSVEPSEEILEGLPDVRMFQDELYADESFEFETFAKRDDFGKIFPNLAYFGEGQDLTDLKKRLSELGAPGGLMDAKDPLVTISNPLDSNPASNPDNPNADMTVGFTFLGQFIDHDLTFDPDGKLSDNPPSRAINRRTARFDLDSVYGGGPSRDSRLYSSSTHFRLDRAAPRDLPRQPDLDAVIADPRNDENVIISQMQLAFINFHNQVVDWLRRRDNSLRGAKLFREAQRLVRWHYQYIVVEQFLRTTLDPSVFQDVYTNGPRFFKPPSDKMPREFQVAAYRFGHSQIRPGYKVNTTFGAPIFDIAIGRRDFDPNDLRGGRRSFRRFVEWDTFFDFGTMEIGIQGGAPVAQPKVKRNKRIDPFMSSPMLQLPVAVGTVPDPRAINSLATRNLRRHIQHRLASGQSVAKAIGVTAHEFPELRDLKFHDNTPLWYYVLAEALKEHSGQRLGNVGSRIVAEVFFALLLSDKESYLSVDRAWKPVLPAGRNPNYKLPDGLVPFTMTDLLSFARVA